MNRVRSVAALSLALAAGVQADIVPLQGIQQMQGRVRVMAPAFDDLDTFELSAPDAMASWAPAAQSLEAAGFQCRVTMQATYVSEIAPESMSVATDVAVRSTGNSRTGILGFLSYSK